MNDIKEVKSADFAKNGIYYWADERDMRKGRAMIIGPEGTPYEACPLIFDVHLPPDYPLKNPTVLFATSDGETRFHPNLYVTGKVCLSILGTWKGPGWSPALSLGKVLLSIQSLLDSNPIANEPSFEATPRTDSVASSYAAFVEERLIGICYPDLLRLKRYGSCPPIWEEFKDTLLELADGLLGQMRAKIITHTEEMTFAKLPYSMTGPTRWLVTASVAEH